MSDVHDQQIPQAAKVLGMLSIIFASLGFMGFMGALASFGGLFGIIGIVFTCAYPVVLLVLLNRDSVQSAFKS